jgi:SecD/SecF fusion protein
VFAIIIGVFVGTYSSVFIAGPMLILFKLRPETFGEESGTKKGKLPAATPAAKA